MKTTKVLKVLEINLSIQEVNPPNLVIDTKGEVTSSGWSNGRLIPFVYIIPPKDGIYEFDFVADRPDGPSSDVIDPIEAKPFIWQDFPNELKGVKVYASQNDEVKMLNQKN